MDSDEGAEYSGSSPSSDWSDRSYDESVMPGLEENQLEAPEREPRESFDVALPSHHSYLGAAVPVAGGRTIYGQEEAPTELLLLPMSGLVLMPGQTMPLTIFKSNQLTAIRSLLTTTKTFASVRASRLATKAGSVGTTAEIFEYHEPPHDSYDRGDASFLHLKVRGEQRFQIVASRRQADGIWLARVRILEEQTLGEIFYPVRLKSHDRFRPLLNHKSALDDESPTSQEVPRGLLRRHFSQLRSVLHPNQGPSQTENNPTLSLGCSGQVSVAQPPLSPFPQWVYNMYEDNCLVQKMTSILRGPAFANVLHVNLPQTPTELSFWVAANLPFVEADRVALLAINCPNQRLRFGLSLIEMVQYLRCKQCSHEIGSRKNMISMTQEGLQGTYVNPGGAVYETLTLSKVYRGSVQLEGNTSTQFSWFPGYAWTIAQCRHCHAHLGWKFSATNRKLAPRNFWGITKASIVPGHRCRGASTPVIVM